jgi:hypothetical protein
MQETPNIANFYKPHILFIVTNLPLFKFKVIDSMLLNQLQNYVQCLHPVA